MSSRRLSRYPPWSLEGKAGLHRGQGQAGRTALGTQHRSLPSSRPEEAGAEVPLLPLDALHALAEQLDQDDLDQALLLLKLFIILCRWFLPGIL